ncbi:MAG: hypothetical protein RRC34_07840 [Lentisphaeria bacterium]|nr:hypothetical protein [Lentisphaeria bacterium]
MIRWIFILLWLGTLAGGQRLVTIRRRQTVGGGDVITRIFGESRALISARMLHKADRYFHGGVMLDNCDYLHGHAHHHEHTDDCGHGVDVDDEALARPAATGDDHYAGAGWYRRLILNTRPAGHTHLSTVREVKELLPWFRLATRLDPHNVQGYDVGAYWLAEKVNAPAKALALIDEGITHNPEAFELALTKGELLMETDPAAADSALAAAEKKWLAARKKFEEGEAYPPHLSPPEFALMERIQVYRAKCMLDLGRREQAIAFFQRALAVSDNKTALQERIRELSSQTNGWAPPPSDH